MEETDRLRYETQSRELRVKIKTWEVDFYNSHNKTKPTRTDIKNNPKIASMYKKYQEARDILDGKIPLPPPHRRRNNTKDEKRKRKSTEAPPPSDTPSTKRFKHAETPSSRRNNAQQHTPAGAVAVTPSLSRRLFSRSPAVPTSIGPTPQRDGRVLGIFDSLSELPFNNADIDSPCRPNNNNNNNSNKAAAKPDASTVEDTPHHKRSKTVDIIKLGMTPSSRHKHHQSPRKETLFATPLKPHDGNRVAKTTTTPSSSSRAAAAAAMSVSKLQFATPAFLRRIPMSKIVEDSSYVSPEPIRLPRKPLLRGLSSVVADLRKLQEEKLDDDLDALRDMENEAETAAEPRTASAKELSTADKKNVTDPAAAAPAKDIEQQTLTLLGGFDDEAQFDSEDETAGLDRDGKPLKVYKKKGQKRTTRKSNMRPVRSRRPAAAAAEKEEAQGGESEDEVILETQRGTTAAAAAQADEQEDPALLSGSEFAASDDEEDELARDMPARKQPVKKQKTSTTRTTKKDNQDANKAEDKVKKTARKVNELAHANFKRLKLRNNGAKGGPGYNSRFRRRR